MSWYKDPNPVPAGYWGPVTSTLLWCEEKYRWSYYVAEPINTLTNLFFIGLSLYGYHVSNRERLPLRYSLCHLGVALVGFGSALFHGTLTYATQLLDELPMIYTSAWLTYCVCETTKGYGKPRFRLLLPTTLTLLVICITITYVWNGNPVFHQIAYASIQLVSTARVVYLLSNKSSPLNTTAAGKDRKREIQNLYLFGAIIFLTGFAIWNIDNIFCYNLRQARNKVGYPWAVLLEGHGWWHIFTGWGAYCLITAGSQLAVGEKEDPSNFTLVRGAFPWVKRVQEYKPPSKSGKKKSS
ncbi:related to YPC1 - Alkaline ceramidase [Melanopsichium pennsylvanicum]|uniref:Related to YPC1 - Alkaline ceramidase n=2 Tax=Melanopsichium pennsylvanicum TaxID=63383 RepID=A0AAJ4XKH4_9BASI|nr:related to YPC1-Alkaline ceramidase [Melanopsichium pennsylvanicum 4]SNX84019.1 related to YPC1 - Alkaline ceramidase [Melanopsichium pennsylvanicum]